MDCTTISISRTLGAGGEEIAHAVAEKTGFRFVDDEIIARAAEKAGVSPETIARVERSPSLIDRILKHLGSTAIEAGQGPYTPIVIQDETYEGLIAQVIREAAQVGKVVILAHGGSIALGDDPGVLRVLITGSIESRVARYSSLTGMKDAECRKAIHKSDGERADFLRRFYNVVEEQPTHYDLVINTDRISADAAASLIVAGSGDGRSV
jgi:cytidylate kinase